MSAHSDLLTGNIDVFRAWRQANPGVKLDCSKADFTNRSAFDHRDLSNVDFSGANFSGARLHDVNFSGSNLPGADPKGAHLSKANFTGANLTDADCSDAAFNEANLTNTQLIGRNLQNANLTAVAFSEHVVLRDANLLNATLQQVSLKGAI